MQTLDMTFVCKKCKKAFRKNVSEFEEAYVQSPNLSSLISLLLTCARDEFCPNCDNHFVIDAVTPKAALKVESNDTRMDSRMLKDERLKQAEDDLSKLVWEDKGGEGKLG